MLSVTTLVILSLTCSALLTGLIWTVQIVHYPGFMGVGEEQFLAYQHQHMRAISYVVIPLMLTELGLSLWLPFQHQGIPNWCVYISTLLVVLIWGVTFFISAPLHGRLATSGYDAELIQRLVDTNWIRTVAWTTRTGILLYMILKLVR